MFTVQKFEDQIYWYWQKVSLLTKEICWGFKSLKFKDTGLCDQIRRALGLVMFNIAENFERGMRQEFLDYLYIAKDPAG